LVTSKSVPSEKHQKIQLIGSPHQNHNSLLSIYARKHLYVQLSDILPHKNMFQATR